MKEMEDEHNEVLEYITEYLHPDIGYSELEDLVESAIYNGQLYNSPRDLSEEELRDFARTIATHLGVPWELTDEEEKEVWEENRMDSERIAWHFGEED